MSDERISREGYVHIGDIAEPLAHVMAQAREAAQPLMQAEAARRDAAAAAERAEAASRMALETKSRIRTAGIPEEHEDVLLAGVDTDRTLIKQAALWHADTAKRILVIGGSVGVGKTLAACWLLAQGPRRAYRSADGRDTSWPHELHPRFIRSSALARLDTYRSSDLALIEACSMLVIDEVGGGDVGAPASWAERLDMIVSGRHDAGRDTIMTTNIGRPAFEREFGARLYDRLTGRGLWINVAGRSLRQPEQLAERRVPPPQRVIERRGRGEEGSAT